MIMKHGFFSVLKDFKAFKSITADREAHFAAGEAELKPYTGGVGELAKSLHPDTQKMTVERTEILFDGFASVCLSALSGKAALFRPGQYVNVRCGDRLFPFFISSSPAEAAAGSYVLAVDRLTSDGAWKFMLSLRPGEQVTLGAPMGYFTRQPLRDGERSAVIADLTGAGAAFSMLSGENTEAFLCGIEGQNTDRLFFVQPEDIRTDADTLFICGRREFCLKTVSLFPDRHVRVLYTDAPSRETDGKDCVCTVLSGEESFTVPCRTDEPLIAALEKSGVVIYNKCRTGDCSFCRARLTAGSVTHVFDGEADGRRQADIKNGFIHPCRAFPDGDLTIKY